MIETLFTIIWFVADAEELQILSLSGPICSILAEPEWRGRDLKEQIAQQAKITQSFSVYSDVRPLQLPESWCCTKIRTQDKVYFSGITNPYKFYWWLCKIRLCKDSRLQGLIWPQGMASVFHVESKHILWATTAMTLKEACCWFSPGTSFSLVRFLRIAYCACSWGVSSLRGNTFKHLTFSWQNPLKACHGKMAGHHMKLMGMGILLCLAT